MTIFEPLPEVPVTVLDGLPNRVLSVRWFVTEHDGVPIGELTPFADSVPRMSFDVHRSIGRSVSGLVVDWESYRDLDLFHHRVQPTVQTALHETFVGDPMGVFMFADPAATRATARTRDRYLSLTLVDRGQIVDQEIGRALGVARGTYIGTALQTFTAQLYGVPFEIESSVYQTAADMTWAPTATWRQVFDDLGSLGGYLPLWFDRVGVGRLMLTPDPDQHPFPDVDYDESRTILAGSVSESYDILQVPNRYVVVEASPQDQPLVGVYDVPLAEPYSIAQRGYAVPRSRTMEGLTSPEHANQVARNDALTDRNPYRTIEWQTRWDRQIDGAGLVQVDGETWLETAWDWECTAGGLVTHRAQRPR